MADSIRPFLMFAGQAEAAIDLYLSLFRDSELERVARYGPEGPGAEGTIMRATIRLGDQRLMCVDSPVEHEFAFTPAFSLFVDCASREEIEGLVEGLSQDGATLMPLGEYGFSRAYAWITDRFGVSWQLNLE